MDCKRSAVAQVKPPHQRTEIGSGNIEEQDAESIELSRQYPKAQWIVAEDLQRVLGRLFRAQHDPEDERVAARRKQVLISRRQFRVMDRIAVARSKQQLQ